MDGFALHETGVLLLADLVLHFVGSELRLEVEEVVEHLHPATGQVVEQVGKGAVFLIQNVRQGKELVVGFEERILHAFQTHAPAAEILLDPEGDEGGLEHVLIEAVVAQRIDEFEQMGDLTRIDDAQAVGVPPHGVADFLDPPVVIFAEAHDAPFKNRRGFGHVECIGT